MPAAAVGDNGMAETRRVRVKFMQEAILFKQG
jgi:hypothetical protein